VSKPVLLAGLLGGVLGAIIGFALMRSFPPAAKFAPSTPTPIASPEARQFADDLVAKLKAGKDEEVMSSVRLAFREMPDDQFNQTVREPYLFVRKHFPQQYGPSRGFEFVRENVVSEDIARFVYLERFAHGCIVWTIVCYNTPTGWQVIGFQHLKLEAAFQVLK
jgi:hypothetical protein